MRFTYATFTNTQVAVFVHFVTLLIGILFVALFVFVTTYQLSGSAQAQRCSAQWSTRHQVNPLRRYRLRHSDTKQGTAVEPKE